MPALDRTLIPVRLNEIQILAPNMRTPQKPSGQVTNQHHPMAMEVSFSMAYIQMD